MSREQNPAKIRGVRLDSALKFPVSNFGLKWPRLSEFMVYACHWCLGVTCPSVRPSVCLSIVLQQVDVISHRVPLSAHEKSFDLGVVTIEYQYWSQVLLYLVHASLTFRLPELNPISHLLALLRVGPKVHISRIKVNICFILRRPLSNLIFSSTAV
jgi:hypothetical protein